MVELGLIDTEIERQVHQYLECETLLRRFFDAADFCYDNCLSQKESLFLRGFPGYLGCCISGILEGGLHAAEFVIKDIRIEKYGSPENKKDGCGYHTREQGCRLKDLKPPICIAYMCPPQKEHIKDEFGIDYNFEPVKRFLQDILEAKVDDAEMSVFKSRLESFIEKIENSG
ncbi:hypothetical protein GOV06_03115 [Candidatus Woesearchaeota archaeon]|nr:hypothetical protein [Candidatus Woesearchaeota archaeon]